jgi:holo-[acyl-carrier protein] synthase
VSRVVGLGLDVVDRARFAAVLERHGAAFERRVYRDGEIRPGATGSARANHLAGLFAAKEAALKALGTGWAQGLAFRQIEVARDRHGAPGLLFHGAAAARAAALGVERALLSITHDGPVAAAVVVLEGRSSEESR